MELGNLRRNVKNNKTSSAKSRTKARTRQGVGQEGNNHSGPDSKLVIINHNRLNDVPVRRTFSIASSINSDASGNIALAPVGCGDIITLLTTEFTNYSQEFQEYRLKSLTMKFFPSTTSATSTTGPYQAALMVSGWKQLRPAAIGTLYQSRSKEIFSTIYEKYIKITTENFPNGKLWNSVAVAYPADRDFGLVWVGLGTVAVTSRIFTTVYELDVEFRIPQ